MDFEGYTKYGKIYDVSYHATEQNRLFARTHGNHFLTSTDNGQTWEIFFSAQERFISNLKYWKDLNVLTFTLDDVFDSRDIYFLDINTKQITKTYTLPNQYAEVQWIWNYDVWQSDPNIMVVIQKYSNLPIVYTKIQRTTDGGQTWKTIYFNEDYETVHIDN